MYNDYRFTWRGACLLSGTESSLSYSDGNSAEFVLASSQDYAPGLAFHYHDGAPHLVSYAIQKRPGKSLKAFANEQFFTPLGITGSKWDAVQDGITFGAFSLYMKPRDLAKFGQLLLQNGKWNGVQLVDSAWISEATAIHVDSGSGSAPYGYYFWIYPALGAYAALGHGGQNIMVFPAKRQVIVYTAWGYTDGDFFYRL